MYIHLVYDDIVHEKRVLSMFCDLEKFSVRLQFNCSINAAQVFISYKSSGCIEIRHETNEHDDSFVLGLFMYTKNIYETEFKYSL